ncbi:unnamed protein product [Discosporangium mesarthrocarpum]
MRIPSAVLAMLCFGMKFLRSGGSSPRTSPVKRSLTAFQAMRCPPPRKSPRRHLERKRGRLFAEGVDNDTPIRPRGKLRTPTRQKIVYAKEPLVGWNTWKQQWDGVLQMRSSKSAPVDRAGSKSLKDSSEGSPAQVRFQVLLSGILSARTRDAVTAQAMGQIREACAPWAVSPTRLLEVGGEECLEDLLYPVGFAKTKAKHILTVCRMLADGEEGREAGDIPSTVKGLRSLPGVGPKVAHLVMDIAWGDCIGICVDTHVHRVSNRLGWVNTWGRVRQSPERTRRALEEWLPKKHWGEVNRLLVGFGQEICQPRKARCHSCVVQDICPSAGCQGDLSFLLQGKADRAEKPMDGDEEVGAHEG